MTAATTTPVSPFAPARFPDLPSVEGVRLATARAEVRYRGREDVMLAAIDEGAVIAGTFTRSSTRAAPVLDCEAKLAAHAAAPADGAGFAFLVNSGNANAFTGRLGERSVAALTEAVAGRLAIPPAHVFTASTGVIGEPLPHERIVAVLDDLAAALAPDPWEKAARAIMTTDTYPKGATASVAIGGRRVTINGIAKGSGMIAPDMATMLVFLFTDAAIPQRLLQDMVSRLTERTFNCITVDGDTSTSDTLLAAATGKAGHAPLATGSAEAAAFEAALEEVMRDLAHQVVKDGEGASKFVTVQVTGAVDRTDAKKVALSIANSPLVKTAIYGEDPNWGRVVMAVGKSGARADRDRLTIRFGDILVAERGWVAEGYREEEAARYMKRREITIGVDLGLGTGEATVWTCDLTRRYIEINADYRS